LECVDAVRREVPDLVILDEYLPWGGREGVLDVLADDSGQRINDLPIVLLTRGGRTPSYPKLRTYRLPRESCSRKLADLAEMFDCEESSVG
jgi:hypothetical protein